MPAKTLTVHSDNDTINRFKDIFGRWDESQRKVDKNARPTQNEFMNAILDLMAIELDVDL